ncbi:metal ABC transporter substrate-binding protein [Calditerricola satsumensis]|uniref:Adhesin n=1 Tax=Calditerricola satsumensis TaxID=373054 RepID=A0A8J3BFD4_9BACI|nr:metal ABC transporter substrate-binding protein [Calditerricola satsumensis]GGK04926.1 adhesin [Calditerricola satsumensis]
MRRVPRSLKGWAAWLALLLVLAGCGQSAAPSVGEQGDNAEKLTVYTSLYPYQFFAEQIGADRVEVHNLVPPGAEPHEFEPTPKDVVKLSEADVFVYNGAGFERWIDEVLDAVDTSNMVIVQAAEHVRLLPNDPHVWLDPLRAKAIAQAIRDALIQADPEGKAIYEGNYQKLAAELDRLHAEYEAAVKQAPRKEIIVSHSAYGYLADRYGLKQIAIAGLAPSDEPSQKDLQAILAFAREHNVKYILFETLVSNKVAEVVREQLKAEALTLNPLEGLTKEERAKGKDYFDVMRENLAVLKKALGVAS